MCRLNYLPASLNAYINSTLEEGRDVAYDLYDDIKEQVVDRTEAQVDQLTDLMEKFFQRAMAVRDSIKQVCEYQPGKQKCKKTREDFF